MSTQTDKLRDIFVEVAGEETVTDEQAEEPSREPVEARDAALAVEAVEPGRDDGLGDAVDGAEFGTEAFASG